GIDLQRAGGGRAIQPVGAGDCHAVGDDELVGVLPVGKHEALVAAYSRVEPQRGVRAPEVNRLPRADPTAGFQRPAAAIDGGDACAIDDTGQHQGSRPHADAAGTVDAALHDADTTDGTAVLYSGDRKSVV